MNNNALHVLYWCDHVYFQGIYLCALSACRRTKCPLIFHLMTMTVNDEKRHWKPIDEEEAIVQMELLGHSFFVFKNVDTDKINVIYKRKDGDYGVIEAN